MINRQWFNLPTTQAPIIISVTQIFPFLGCIRSSISEKSGSFSISDIIEFYSMIFQIFFSIGRYSFLVFLPPIYHSVGVFKSILSRAFSICLHLFWIAIHFLSFIISKSNRVFSATIRLNSASALFTLGSISVSCINLFTKLGIIFELFTSSTLFHAIIYKGASPICERLSRAHRQIGLAYMAYTQNKNATTVLRPRQKYYISVGVACQ